MTDPTPDSPAPIEEPRSSSTGGFSKRSIWTGRIVLILILLALIFWFLVMPNLG